MYVLFVDDDESNLVAWEAACAPEFSVLTAANAEAALQYIARFEVAVLVADQRIPTTSGVELLETVRRKFPDTIRILTTAYSDLPSAVAAINRGQVRRYLRKPFGAGELKAEVRDALELYDMRRKIANLERRLLQTERVYSLGLIAASLAHEIRNPLSWIRDNVRLTREEIQRFASNPNADPSLLRSRFLALDEGLDDALMGVQRIMDIVQSLELSTRDKGDECVDLAEVLRVVLRMLRGELKRCAELELDTAPTPRVRGTSTQLGQVVLNLIVNALQALGNEPAERNVISIRLGTQDDLVFLDVLDNGPGIPPSDIDHVFDTFYTTKGAGGTGLGLAISKRIVEELGGTISAENRPEGGACFRLRLPIRR